MRRGLLLLLLAFLVLPGLTLAQETTPEPELPTLTPTASETATATLPPVTD